MTGQGIEVRKQEYGTGKSLLAWRGTVLRATEDEIVLRARFNPRSGREPVVDGVQLCIGDIFTEHFFLNRWYNVFHLASGDGRFKGWYCNVTQPAIASFEAVSYVDLALDLFVHPDGHFSVLDEDEFRAARQTLYSAADAALAQVALAQLIDLASRSRLPALIDRD